MRRYAHEIRVDTVSKNPGSRVKCDCHVIQAHGERRTENAPKPRSPRKKHASTVHKAVIEGRTRLDYDIIV